MPEQIGDSFQPCLVPVIGHQRGSRKLADAQALSLESGHRENPANMVKLFLRHLLLGPRDGLSEIRKVVVAVNVSWVRFHSTESVLPESVHHTGCRPDEEPGEVGV